MTAVVTRRKMLANDTSHLMFLVMVPVVNDLINTGSLHFFSWFENLIRAHWFSPVMSRIDTLRVLCFWLPTELTRRPNEGRMELEQLPSVSSTNGKLRATLW